MSNNTKTFAKGGIATAAVGAMALAGATPAQARDRNGIDAGDIIAGAVILGGIAAVASAVGKKDRYNDGYRYSYHDRDYRYNDRYNSRYGYNDYRKGNARAAIKRCVNAVERDARRAGYRFADVTEIRDVDRERYGWEVKGRLVVDGQRGWGRYNQQYNRYDRYDRSGRWDRGYDRDAGKFTCDVSRGRIMDIDYRGIRGLR